MLRRTFIALGASVGIAALGATGAFAADVIKIGASAPKTGPLAGGAAMTHWPNVKMWVDEVNAAGGLDVGGTKHTIEIV